MNHLGAIDCYDNKEEEQKQPEPVCVHTQEQQHAHVQDHELDDAIGEQHDTKRSYQQQQQRLIKPHIFSCTKGRKSKTHAAKVAKSAANKTSHPVRCVEFGLNGKPLGIRAYSGCNMVTKHNARTCPNCTDAIVDKQKMQKQIRATQVSTTGHDAHNSSTCGKCGGTDGHNAYTCKLGKINGIEQKQGKVQSSKKSKEEDEEEEFDEHDDQSDKDNEDDSIWEEEPETDNEAAMAKEGNDADKGLHSHPVRRSSRRKNP
nr:zinc finger CCHC-type and RNA-binding motif-containing protein 1-like [Aegilops tauschii subsp. strangulata]